MRKETLLNLIAADEMADGTAIHYVEALQGSAKLDTRHSVRNKRRQKTSALSIQLARVAKQTAELGKRSPEIAELCAVIREKRVEISQSGKPLAQHEIRDLAKKVRNVSSVLGLKRGGRHLKMGRHEEAVLA